MSGIDEQFRDIPMCPICESVPSFWILYPTMERITSNGWYWFFSDVYLERNPQFTKVTFGKGVQGRRVTLDDIVRIVCSDKNNHEFIAIDSVFQKIIQCARRLGQ